MSHCSGVRVSLVVAGVFAGVVVPSVAWSSFSRTGVHGDATKATAEKGRALLDAAVAECVAYVRELRARPLPERREPRETPQ
jgi:creatinine amidohydrolase/Fe(II)-dependent formamide hydrolase-like protein